MARQGSGTRVAAVQPAAPPGGAAPSPIARPRPAYDLRVGTPDLAAFPRRAWLAAVRQAMTELPHEALGYGDPGGVPEPGRSWPPTCAGCAPPRSPPSSWWW